ncbi:MAG: hypothetical protein D6731_23960 [Planctomycetota bacterium]|nr:MAG: hypothetical protein D6731_23960 [Planctomycetota bacterium]
MTFPPNASSGWTASITNDEHYSAGSNVFLLDGRDAGRLGFKTRPAPPLSSTEQPEEYYYSVEIAPFNKAADVDQLGPFMPPVLDDVTIYYMPWGAARVLREEEVIDE